MSSPIYQIICCFCIFQIAVGEIIETPDGPLVTITDGPILGKTNLTVGQNKTYYAFQGIPFAKPPIGDLRFRPPIPNDPWNDTLIATEDQNRCVQGSSDKISGSEDCLYICVYVPKTDQEKLPVMFHIYGGSFDSGFSEYAVYAPDYLLDQDVVYVVFNYRVGIFGFISTGDLVQPGNDGLRDQILALKWVQKHIANFGGDPNSVTMFGESTGSISISYLLQTELADGLYHRGIMQSGTTLSLMALNRNSVKIVRNIAGLLGIDSNSSQSMVDGLRQVNYTNLQNAASWEGIQNLLLENPLHGLPFAPVIEPDHPDAVVTGKSHQLLVEGKFNKVPTIVGFTSNEAATAAMPQNLIVGLYFFAKYDINASRLVPADLNIHSEEELGTAGLWVRLNYFGVLPIALNQLKFVDFASDDQFLRPIHETVVQQSKHAPVYYYRFSFEGTLGGVENRTVPGVGHAEDLWYIFISHSEIPPTEQDLLTRDRVVKLWANFAKYGDPTPDYDPLFQNIRWTPNTGENEDLILCYDINTDLTLQVNPSEQKIQFWKDVYEKYGVPPYDTY